MNVPLLREPEPGDLLKQVRLLGQPVSDEALDLLRERRRIRRLGTLWTTPGGVMAAVLLVLGFRASSTHGELPYLVACSLTLTLTILVRHEVIRRAERRLALLLPRRLGRTSAVSVVTVLGQRVMILLTVIVVLHVTMVVVLFTRGETAAATGFAAICAAAYLLSALALVQVAGRPVLAVDPLTLAVDDRLRTHDATVTYLPAFLASAMFVTVTTGVSDMTTLLLGQCATFLPLIGNVVSDSRWKQAPLAYPSWPQNPGPQQ